MAIASSAVGARRRFAGLSLVPALAVDSVTRSFGPVRALDDVSLEVRPGEVHALLGPNGAGKTTLLRLLTGLVMPTSGCVTVLGSGTSGHSATLRGRIGFVPSGDRSFYERLSGEENLLFFARLQGMRKSAARRRVAEVLEQVGLADAARRPVAAYSHGMQKRLSVARAALTSPSVLLVDEATHDLDPENAARVRELIAGLAAGGSAVLWATQRIEEIRGFADSVTLLVEGRVRFAGAVAALLAHADAKRYVLRVGGGQRPSDLQAALGPAARLTALEDPGHLLVELQGTTTLGDVVSALLAAGARVHDCRRERAEAEEAFLALSAGDRPGVVA
jgi:ABC-2 type transport system ATP-binding protein